MAYENIYEIKWLLLMVIGLPLISSTNIDCRGKSFHCLNVTHFMICVDIGGGILTTVDDFVIPCPPPTVCISTNRFECEFPPTTTVTLPPTTTPYSTPWWSEDPASTISSTPEIVTENTSQGTTSHVITFEPVVFYGNETDAEVTSTTNPISTDVANETTAGLTEQALNVTNPEVIVNETQIFGDYSTSPIQEQHLEISSVNPNTYTSTDVSILVTKYSTLRDNTIPYVTESYTENFTIDLSKDLEETTTNDKKIINNNTSIITKQQDTEHVRTESNQSLLLSTTLSVNGSLPANVNEESTTESPVQSRTEKASESTQQYTVTYTDNNQNTNNYTTSAPQPNTEILTNGLTEIPTTDLPKLVSKVMFVDDQSLFTPELVAITSTLEPVVEIGKTSKTDILPDTVSTDSLMTRVTTSIPEVFTEKTTTEAVNINTIIEMQSSPEAKFEVPVTVVLNENPVQFSTTDVSIINKMESSTGTDLDASNIPDNVPLKEESTYIQKVLNVMKNSQDKPVTDEPVRFYNITGTENYISFTELSDSGAETTNAAIPVLATPPKVKTATLVINKLGVKQNISTTNILDPLLEIGSVTKSVRFETTTDISHFQFVSEAQQSYTNDIESATLIKNNVADSYINPLLSMPDQPLQLSTVIVMQDEKINPAINIGNNTGNVDQNLPILVLSDNVIGTSTDQPITEENLEILHSNILTDDLVDLVNVVSNGAKKFPDQELRKLTAAIAKVDVNSNTTELNENLEYTTATSDAMHFLPLVPMDQSEVGAIANVAPLNLSDSSLTSQKVNNSHIREININDFFNHTKATGAEVSVTTSPRLDFISKTPESETTAATIVSATTLTSLDILSNTLEKPVKSYPKTSEMNRTEINDLTTDQVKTITYDNYGTTNMTLVKESNTKETDISTSSITIKSNSALLDNGLSVSSTISSNESYRLDEGTTTMPTTGNDVQVTALSLDTTSFVETSQTDSAIEVMKPESNTVQNILTNTVTEGVTLGNMSNGSSDAKKHDQILIFEENISQKGALTNTTEKSIQLIITTQKTVIDRNFTEKSINNPSVKNQIAETIRTTEPMSLDFINTTPGGIVIEINKYLNSTDKSPIKEIFQSSNKTWSTRDSSPLKDLNVDNTVFFDGVPNNSNISNKNELKPRIGNIQVSVPINTIPRDSIFVAEKMLSADKTLYSTEKTFSTTEIKNSNHSNKKENLDFEYNDTIDIKNTAFLWGTTESTKTSTVKTSNKNAEIPVQKNVKRDSRIIDAIDIVIQNNSVLYISSTTEYPADINDNLSTTVSEPYFSDVSSLVENVFNVSSIFQGTSERVDHTIDVYETNNLEKHIYNNNSMSVEVNRNKEQSVSSSPTHSGNETYNFHDVNNLVESAIKDFNSYQNVNSHIYDILENTLESALTGDLNKNYSVTVPQKNGNVDNSTIISKANGSELSNNTNKQDKSITSVSEKPNINGTIAMKKYQNFTNEAHQQQANQSSLKLISDPITGITVSNVTITTTTAKSINVTNDKVSESKLRVDQAILKTLNQNLTDAVNQSSLNLVSDPIIGQNVSNVTTTTAKSIAEVKLYATTDSSKEKSTFKTIQNKTQNIIISATESISESKVTDMISEKDHHNFSIPKTKLQMNQSTVHFVSDPTVGVVAYVTSPTMPVTDKKIIMTTNSLKENSTHKMAKMFPNNIGLNSVSVADVLVSSTELMDRIPPKEINQSELEKSLMVNKSQISKENGMDKTMSPGPNNIKFYIKTANTISTEKGINKLEPAINSSLKGVKQIGTDEVMVKIPPKEVIESESVTGSIGIVGSNREHEATVANVNSFTTTESIRRLLLNNTVRHKENSSYQTKDLVQYNTNSTILNNAIESNEKNKSVSIKTSTSETFKIIPISNHSTSVNNNVTTSGSGVITNSFDAVISKETNQPNSATKLIENNSNTIKQNSIYKIFDQSKNNITDKAVNNTSWLGVLENSTASTSTTTPKDTNKLLSSNTLENNNFETIKENINITIVDLKPNNTNGITIKNMPVIDASGEKVKSIDITVPQKTNQTETTQSLILDLDKNNKNHTVINTTHFPDVFGKSIESINITAPKETNSESVKISKDMNAEIKKENSTFKIIESGPGNTNDARVKYNKPVIGTLDVIVEPSTTQKTQIKNNEENKTKTSNKSLSSIVVLIEKKPLADVRNSNLELSNHSKVQHAPENTPSNNNLDGKNSKNSEYPMSLNFKTVNVEAITELPQKSTTTEKGIILDGRNNVTENNHSQAVSVGSSGGMDNVTLGSVLNEKLLTSKSETVVSTDKVENGTYTPNKIINSTPVLTNHTLLEFKLTTNSGDTLFSIGTKPPILNNDVGLNLTNINKTSSWNTEETSTLINSKIGISTDLNKNLTTESGETSTTIKSNVPPIFYDIINGITSNSLLKGFITTTGAPTLINTAKALSSNEDLITKSEEKSIVMKSNVPPSFYHNNNEVTTNKLTKDLTANEETLQTSIPNRNFTSEEKTTLPKSNVPPSFYDNNYEITTKKETRDLTADQETSTLINTAKPSTFIYKENELSSMNTDESLTTASQMGTIMSDKHESVINSYEEESTTNRVETRAYLNEDLVSTVTTQETSGPVFENKETNNGDEIAATNQEDLLTQLNKQGALTYIYEDETTTNRDVTETLIPEELASTSSSTEATSTYLYEDEAILSKDQTEGTLNKEPVSSTSNKEDIPNYVYEDGAYTKKDTSTSLNQDNALTSNHIEEISTSPYDEVASTVSGQTIATSTNDQNIVTMNTDTSTFVNDLSTAVNSQTSGTPSRETSTIGDNTPVTVNDQTAHIFSTTIKENIPSYSYDDVANLKTDETTITSNKENPSTSTHVEEKITYDEIVTTVRSQTSAAVNMETSTFVTDVSTAVSDQSSATFNKESATNDNIVSSTEPSTATKDQEDQKSPELSFNCNNRLTGRYADDKDCTKFYICSGISEPIVGKCPANTVFSNYTKRCTKNLSLCVRMNQFKCLFPGRYIDYRKINIYYICIKSGKSFRKFKFQCQKGYILDRQTVKCNLKEPLANNQSKSQSTVDQKSHEIEKVSKEIEKDSKETEKDSRETERDSKDIETDSKETETYSKERKADKKSKQKNNFICEEEGRFPFEHGCQKYYECTRKGSSEKFRLRVKKCGKNKVFHKKKRKCIDDDDDSYECS